MDTLLINEKLIAQFKFWLDGQVQQGMRFRNELFGCAAGFQSSQRHEAFDLAWRLSQRPGQQVVVTTSNFHYTVWVSLRSSESQKTRTANQQLALTAC
ncbi:MAG TPA: hypothetical protein V6D18_05850 [Thermosynechococcaceae cyanobacterium]